MKLIERYLNEIARRLPRRQRDDVREELRSALGDALDNRVEGEPTEEDVVELLQEFGSPQKVASSYRAGSRYLIGPALYPTFRSVTGVVLTVLVSLVVVGFVLDLAIEPSEAAPLWRSILGFLSEIQGTALSAFAIVVIIFALIERFGESDEPEKRWDPYELPEVRDLDLVGRGEAIAGIAIPVVFLLLMNLLRNHFGVRVNPGEELLLNDVFWDNLPWLNLAMLSGIALNAWLLRAGRWRWTSRLFDGAIDLYWIWILFRISGAVSAREATLVAAGLTERVAAMLVGAVALVPWIVILIVIWGAAKVIYRNARSGA